MAKTSKTSKTAASTDSQTVTSEDVGSMPAQIAGETSTESSGQASTESSGETAAQTEARKRAAPSNFLPIVRGRLPLVFVHAVRFNAEIQPMGNKDLAAKLGTSVGKIFDIRKGRNFSYVDASFKPTADDVASAKNWIEQVGSQNAKGVSAQGDRALMQKLLADCEKGGLATAEEAAAFSAARTSTRAPKAVAGATASTKAPATEKVGETAGATADDLLS